eukprot:3199858-Prymnesium_polylepis.1
MRICTSVSRGPPPIRIASGCGRGQTTRPSPAAPRSSTYGAWRTLTFNLSRPRRPPSGAARRS